MAKRTNWERLLRELGQAVIDSAVDQIHEYAEEDESGKRTARIGGYEWPVPPIRTRPSNREVPRRGQNQRREEPKKPTPYSVLEVAEGASFEVCAAAHKALSKRYHPDVVGGDAKKMSEVNAAFDKIKKANKTR